MEQADDPLEPDDALGVVERRARRRRRLVDPGGAELVPRATSRRGRSRRRSSASFHQSTACWGARQRRARRRDHASGRSGYALAFHGLARATLARRAGLGGRIVDGHAGEQAVAALRHFGVDVMFTLNGGHIWPLYEAARNQGMRVVDTRHEQTATFAAEAYAKLTRRPGLAVLTAGPGVTNGVSAITSACFNGSPLVVLGGRAPQGRWGAGSLQELDHVPIVASITKLAATVTDATEAGAHGRTPRPRSAIDAAPRAGVPRLPARRVRPASRRAARRRAPVDRGVEPDPDAVAALAALIAGAERPAFIVGSDVYWDGAWDAAGAPRSSTCGCRASSTGSAGACCRPTTSSRSCAPAALLKRARRPRRRDRHAARLPPRLRSLRRRRRSPTSSTPTSQRAGHVDVPTVGRRHRGRCCAALRRPRRRRASTTSDWIAELRDAEQRGRGGRRRSCSRADSDPIKPTRIYGELAPAARRDAVVICDGGDFASLRRQVRRGPPARAAGSTPVRTAASATGMGYAIAARVARPDARSSCCSATARPASA